jgi:CheY-like chemotaxis protein
VEKGEAAGFDRHLVKPVDEATLVAALAALRTSKSQEPSS